MKLTMQRRTKMYVTLGMLYAGGVLFFGLTDPSRLPLLFLIVPFLWLFVTLFLTIWLLLLHVPLGKGRRRRVILAGSGAALPVLLLVFESIHQLTLRDIVLSAALVLGIAFYMSRADFID